MAKSRARRRTKFVQYSKRLATGIAGFWALFRLLGLAVTLARPEIAESLQAIFRGVDDVMMCNVGFYAGNSIAEKGIVSYFGSRAPVVEDESDSNG